LTSVVSSYSFSCIVVVSSHAPGCAGASLADLELAA
jgi:hypothetical protein